MNTEQIITAINSKNLQPGWAVFYYNIKYAFSRIFGRLFLLLVFISASIVLLYSSFKEENTNFLIFAVIAGLPAIIYFFALIPVAVELIYSKNNFIVMTDAGVLKSFKGKTEFFPYDVITNVKFSNPYGASTPAIAKRKEQFLDFTDKRNNRFVNLAKNRIFGPPENIYNILLSKLPLEQKTALGQTFSNYSNFFNH